MLAEYGKAYKKGKKDYQLRMMKGERPTLPVLDEMLPAKGTYKEVPLGIVKIPLDSLVGTKTNARSNAFASNFMPILSEKSEFAEKWANLYKSQVSEGIREPIKAYEYMNQFYVEEGNKRVSVMKYVGMDSIPGSVTRIIPNKTDELENKIYYEFLDFYELSKINYIWFSKEGNFSKLQKAVGKAEDEVWTDDDRMEFNSAYIRFKTEYKANNGELFHITVGDAFLAFIKLHGYQKICGLLNKELKDLILKSWEEFTLLDRNKEVDVKMDPNYEKESIFNKLKTIGSGKLKVAFVYAKTPTSSAWTYAHELGRLHLEQKFPDEVETIYYDNITKDSIEEVLEKCVAEKCDIIFTTTPAFVHESVTAAIAHPNVRIVNCSLRTSHRYIRTYYSRMYEAKFLMGAIAGVMTENNRLAYIADYPIRGSIANINAFALGVKMVNPKAKVYLEWASKKDFNRIERLKELDVDIVSDKDMVVPEDAKRFYGLYRFVDERPIGLAMPVWQWGVFYEQMIRTIMEGTWKNDDNIIEKKAINYWWGMSAGVIDMICSRNLPIGTKRLVELIKTAISRGEFNPFYGKLYSHNGVVQEDANRELTPEEIILMDWLAENVVGSIPAENELVDHSLPVIKQQGIDKEGE